MIYYPTIWVEGIIGAGKTTFATEIGRRLDLRVIEEPVEENPYLGLFYKDQKKYAFGFQIFMLHRRCIQQRLAADEATGVGGFKGAILDRSLFGDRVFAKIHVEEGNIEQIDYNTYEMAYSFISRTLLPPSLLVFLDIQPETALTRVNKRKRPEEDGLPLEYLQKLRSGYLRMLVESERGLLPWGHAVKVCRIPWDPDTLTEEEWNRVALTIEGACGILDNA